jgi:hypothetical protein
MSTSSPTAPSPSPGDGVAAVPAEPTSPLGAPVPDPSRTSTTGPSRATFDLHATRPAAGTVPSASIRCSCVHRPLGRVP